MHRVAVVAAVVALAGCGTEDPSPTVAERAAASITRAEIGGQPTLTATPKSPNGRVVLYVHGSGEDEESILTEPVRAPLVAALLDAGYTVAASRADGNAWGSPASVRAHEALAADLRRRGLRDVYVLAQSMGGLAGTKLIARVKPKAWAGLFPICDASSVTSLRDEIEEAYDGPPPASVSPVTVTAVRGLRMTFWASPDDKIVPKDRNADVCAEQAQAAGADVREITTRGDHGDASNFDARLLLERFG